MVEEIARASGCGLISNDSGDLELWAPSVEEVESKKRQEQIARNVERLLKQKTA